MPAKPKHFRPSRSAEVQFSRALKKVAKVSGHMVEAHVEGHQVVNWKGLEKALHDYSQLIGPWARRQAGKMLEQVSKSNRRAYNKKSKEMGALLKLNVAQEDVGQVAAKLMAEHVELIKSIPVRAGIRAQSLSMEAVYNGARASEVAEELRKSTKVSKSSAKLIARTEVARANASITQARASSLGAQSYIWRTTMDGAERDSHAKMNGKTVLYSEEPVLIDGTKGHAGTFPNCRCYQDVQFDSK